MSFRGEIDLAQGRHPAPTKINYLYLPSGWGAPPGIRATVPTTCRGTAV